MIDEKAMVAAHKAGIAAYNVNGTGINLQDVIDHAAKTYATDDEQDSFVAGYIGAKRRAQGSKL